MDTSQLKAFVRNGVFRMELEGKSPYQAFVSTGNSGVSFGAMQNDVGIGPQTNKSLARTAFETIMNLQVQSHALTQSAAQQLIAAAENNPHGLTQTQLNTISTALAAHRDIVDATDNANFAVAWSNLNGAMQAAAANPKGPGALNSVAPDPLLLVELAEWGNRTGGLSQSSNFLRTAPEVSLQYRHRRRPVAEKAS
jgi:hypothetical protein